MSKDKSKANSRTIAIALAICLAVPIQASAECGGFIRWSSQTLDSYQRKHRVYPVESDARRLAIRLLPALWVTPDSWKPIDFDRYLKSSELFRDGQKTPLARGDQVRPAIAKLDREAQCSTWLRAPEQPPAAIAPVYIQVYNDVGPNGEPGWLYFKYTYVFDWSGLAEKRSFASRVGATLTGGNPDRWHRLDVHTSAVVGVDAKRVLRTLTLQQHNDKRTYVAGLDFPVAPPLTPSSKRGGRNAARTTGASSTSGSGQQN